MNIRKANSKDLSKIIELLQDDTLGQSRESLNSDDMAKYQNALSQLLNSEYFDVYVMELNFEIIGCYQLMFLPHLSHTGTQRGQIESVRVRKDHRNKGLGSQLIKHAIEVAKEQGCGMFQLTSNKQRKEANKFYRNLGLEPSHDGYKLMLSQS